MTDTIFNRGKQQLIASAAASLDIRALLLGNSGGSVATGHDVDFNFVSDVLGTACDELVATNYARKTVTSITITEDDTNNRVEIDWAVPAWTALGGASNDTVRAVLFYVHNVSDGAAPLISLHDFSPAIPTNGGDFTCDTPNGTLRLT